MRPPYCCNGKVFVDTIIGSPERIGEYFFEITSLYVKLMSNFLFKRGLFIIQWGSLLFLRGSPFLKGFTAIRCTERYRINLKRSNEFDPNFQQG